ncbi:MAG: hypothetical protein SGJ27_17665 [Candidatus Melainabacteria bacterium]|nr:hypothetical protein [Candidatus Melainabacteria bacterium]
MTDKEERIAHLMNVVTSQAKEIDSLKESQKSQVEAESEMMGRIREAAPSSSKFQIAQEQTDDRE